MVRHISFIVFYCITKQSIVKVDLSKNFLRSAQCQELLFIKMEATKKNGEDRTYAK
jgi:hypothetical protein